MPKIILYPKPEVAIDVKYLEELAPIDVNTLTRTKKKPIYQLKFLINIDHFVFELQQLQYII